MVERRVPLEDVPYMFRITPLTMYRWLVDGRLSVKTGADGQGNQRIFVTEKSIRGAYKVKCIHCGEAFSALGPKRGRYCSIACRHAYQRRPRKPRINWAAVDWEMNDAEISRQVGCTNEAVRMQRRRRGIGRSPRFRFHAATLRNKVTAMDTARMTANQIAKKAGCSVSYVHYCHVLTSV